MTDWKKVWQKKGEKITSDLIWLDGFEKTNINPVEVANKIIDILNIKTTDKVLEVGCGAGMLAHHLKNKCFYVGLDMTESLLRKHAGHLKNYVIQSDANDIPFKDNYFDKCFSYSVFHYFPDIEYIKKTILEMSRVTKTSKDKYNIFIGDLPTKSHDNNHFLFNHKMFSWLGGFYIFDGYYTKDRFNVAFQ